MAQAGRPIPSARRHSRSVARPPRPRPSRRWRRAASLFTSHESGIEPQGLFHLGIGVGKELLFLEAPDHRAIGLADARIDRERGMCRRESVIDLAAETVAQVGLRHRQQRPGLGIMRVELAPPGNRSASPAPRGGCRRDCRSPNIAGPAGRACRPRRWWSRAARSPSSLRGRSLSLSAPTIALEISSWIAKMSSRSRS